MFGINTYFKCPNCEFSGVVDLGITQFVKIKGVGDKLAVRDCPKCEHNIAFKVVAQPGKPGNFGYRPSIEINGNIQIVNKIKQLIWDTKEVKEENIKNSVIGAIKSEYGNEYAHKYHEEIVTIIELEMCSSNIPCQVGIDLEKVPKEDIEVAGVVCY